MGELPVQIAIGIFTHIRITIDLLFGSPAVLPRRVTRPSVESAVVYPNSNHNSDFGTSIFFLIFLQVKIKINGQQFIEGTDVKITCDVEANPPATQFHWYLNDNIVKSESATELVLKNISREQHESIVKCEATNMVGKSEDSETLHVVCK